MADREFPADNGTVDGQPAYVTQEGSRTEAYYGDDHEGKIVTNDGVNASFVRDPSGKVVVDDSKDDPYEPYWFSRRK